MSGGWISGSRFGGIIGGAEMAKAALLASSDISATKTNIGTAYVDIYNAAFQPDYHAIDFTDYVDFRVLFGWDYVGTGSQQIRFVDQANNANILWEPAAFTVDQDPADSGWIVLPAWATGVKTIEWQGKSTVGTDDPVAKYYRIYLR